jgi:Zn-dependent protease with chaperone function
VTVRLDPFIFPSDTSLRFVILNTFVLGWTALLAASVASQVILDAKAQAAAVACGERLFSTLGMLHMIRIGLDELLPDGRFADCLASFPGAARFTIVNLLIVMAVAVAAYYTHHLWIIRRHRLVPLPAEAMPELTVALEELRHRAGLARPVHFFWNPLASHGVRAFGGLRHPCIALSGGLVAEFAHDRRRFTAIVLHELAHHRNRDVAKTFSALAIFWSFLFAAVTPYAVTEALRLSRTWDISSGVWGSVRLALIVGIVYLTRNALLRARELYADARVAGWIPPAAILEAMHERAAAMDRQRWPPAVADVHPSLRQRRRALEQPSSLLQASGWDAFGTGLAAAAAIVPAAFALILVLVVLLDTEGLLSALGSRLNRAKRTGGLRGRRRRGSWPPACRSEWQRAGSP